MMLPDANDKRLLYEVVADQLIERIEQGYYAIGNFIPPERDLAQEYQVSRSTIREAVRVLEQRGYLENIYGGKRKLVRSASLESQQQAIYGHLEKARIEDYLDARTYLDDIIVTLACQRATEEDLRQIELVYQRLYNCYYGEPVAPDDVNWAQFHLAIAEAAHNSVLENVYRMALSLMPALRRETLQTKADRTRMLEEHESIFLFIKERNIPAARLAIQIHNHNVKTRYEKQKGKS